MNLQARLEEILTELRLLQVPAPSRHRAVVVTELEKVAALVEYYKL